MRSKEYVSLTIACQMLKVTKSRVRGYAEQGLIGVERLPDVSTRYCRADILALIERSRTRAKAPEALAMAC